VAEALSRDVMLAPPKPRGSPNHGGDHRSAAFKARAGMKTAEVDRADRRAKMRRDQ
jgi:hypothetical protein